VFSFVKQLINDKFVLRVFVDTNFTI